MTKRPEGGSGKGGREESSRSRPEILVRDSRGRRYPFLRGMVTHDLVQRGLSFEDAYAAARAVRDRISPRTEISTAELKDLLEQQLAEMYGPEGPVRFAPLPPPEAPLRVLYPGDSPQPFSRGLLARSIHAAGVDLDRSYRLVTLLEAEYREEGVAEVEREELARQVGDLLERHQGREAAVRYRLMRSIQGLPRPLVIYLGGASGTGKSTLALDLAPLLRIYRINATDTIRQVMRMVFSPAILPALHRSSFEGLAPYEHPFFDESQRAPGEGDHRERLIATFEEQATRVCVGVRAVVERAMAENMSIVVEGVHLVPPLVPFADLEGAAYQLMLLLTTLDEERHRTRFLARGRGGSRRAERYLESFAAIRLIQEFLLEQAELHDVPLLETTDRDSSLVRSLRLVSGLMQQRFPDLVEGRPRAPRVPTLLLFLDGLPDQPVRALGWRTPLQVASTPHLDRLAWEGRCGLADPVAPGVVPDTASGSLALFGQSPRGMKRGPVEALGAGLVLAAGDVALRGNFATLDERGWIVDRRAGRIREGARELAAALDGLLLPGALQPEVVVRVRVSTEHRLAVVLKGEGLSSAIVGSDPGEGAPPSPPLTPRAADPVDRDAVRTARILAAVEGEARRILAGHPVNLRRASAGQPVANAILTRGAGRIHRLLPLEQAGLPMRVTCVSGDHTILGIAGWLGARTVTSEGMTANLDTDLEAKFAAARESLADSDLVVLHIKGADIAAHDGRSDRKVRFIEEVDAALGRFLDEVGGPLRIVVASDHTTLSELGQHGADPVPVLVWDPEVEADGVARFDEQSAAAGELQRFPLQLLVRRLFD